MHSLVVTVELVAPVEVVLFTTVTEQVTSFPAPAGAVAGKSGGLHWMMEGAVTVASGDAAAAGALWATRATHVPIESTTSRLARRVLPVGLDLRPTAPRDAESGPVGLDGRWSPAEPPIPDRRDETNSLDRAATTIVPPEVPT